MAKSTKTKNTDLSGASSISLSSLINKISDDAEILETSTYATIDEWIPTGSYILNACISGSLFGGLPNRRSICLAGDSGCLTKDEKVSIYTLKSNISQQHGTIIVR